MNFPKRSRMLILSDNRKYNVEMKFKGEYFIGESRSDLRRNNGRGPLLKYERLVLSVDMTTFGWKRKSGEKICKASVQIFEKNAKDEDDVEEINSGEVDWLTLAPKRRVLHLEDSLCKSKRLKHEGTVLADAERYWEAVKKWEDAILFTPNDSSLYEMKAQAYLCLNEVFPAVKAATMAVELDPRWWVAHQTLGRANLSVGEVRLAIKSFSRAVHLNPSEMTLWEDDLHWAQCLWQRKLQAKTDLETVQLQQQEESKCKIVELDGEGENKELCTQLKGMKGGLDTKLLHLDSRPVQDKPADVHLLKQNYVIMRD